MTPLGCEDARELLQAFHDDELSLEQTIAVEQHLEWCSPCTWEMRRLAAIGEGLRGAANVLYRSAEPRPLQPAVLSRLRAEEDQRLPATVARMFEDLHLVWAAVGATAAATLCVTVILTMLSLAAPSPGRADSLAGLLSMLSSTPPKSSPVDGRVSLPRVDPNQAMPVMVLTADDVVEDRVFALAGIVTSEGRLTDLKVVMANHRDRDDLVSLLDVASTARFQPARLNDSPVAVSMVWLVARTTVRARVTLS